MRVLIIDDCEDFRLMASQYLAIEWPEVEVEEHDPVTDGIPGLDFDWSVYDVILLGHRQNSGHALDWLDNFCQSGKCPPVIFLVDSAEETIVVQALKSAAIDYTDTRNLGKTALIEAIKSAVAKRQQTTEKLANMDEESVSLSILHNQLRNIDKGDFLFKDNSKPINIKDYRILKELGKGGMSAVYLAERTTDKLLLALKILDNQLTNDNVQLERFIQEYAIISKLQSTFVVKIYEQGFTDERVYIAMEYFPGGDLKSHMNQPLTPKQSLTLIRDIGQALRAIHAEGIVHRDLKPKNIMFRQDKSLALVDFGSSKELNFQGDLTQYGQVIGTLYYMSPEQCKGALVDNRSDLYSLGIIFYEMITGKRAYTGKSPHEILDKHVNAPIPRLPELLLEYQELLERLLAKKTNERFQSADELLQYVKRKWSI